MTFQYSVIVRNARLDAIETAVGTGATIKIFSGAEPANCAASDPAGLLATVVCPSDWMNAASAGAKTKLGVWTNTASGSGTAACFRLYDNAVNTCHIQGSVGLGSGDMSVDNTNFAAGQTFTVNTFTITGANT
jgi:hypothetical protein